jgi:DNA-binding SARP family transcriptional activator/predicted ATPase
VSNTAASIPLGCFKLGGSGAQNRMTDQSFEGLSIQLLGGFQLFAGDHRVGDAQFRLRKARSLVKVLALTPHHRLHRDQLVDLLWADQDPTLAANSFHQTLYAARRVLTGLGLSAQAILSLNDEILSLCSTSALQIDVEEFETRATRAHSSRDPLDYQAALTVYTGDLLPEDPYEEWAAARREGLRQEHLRLLLELARLEESRGENEKAASSFQQVIEHDPVCEEAYAGLMRLNALNGQRSVALAQYDSCRRLLQKELGVEPSPDTSALYERIRAGELGGTLTPPLPAVFSISSQHKPDLPTWLFPFIGREDLLTEIQARLDDPACRLLTLVGPGGSGKTRLAVEAARTQVAAFPQGVFFVPLVSLQSARSIPAAIAQNLAFNFHTKSDPSQQLQDYLKEKTILLVLDNFEHLLEGAGLITEFLHAAPRVKILVTSRAALNLQGETLLPVPGLSYPEEPPNQLTDVLHYSSVELFLKTAQRVDPGYQPDDEDLVEMVKICRQVAGLPLAIVLSAAWTRVLSPAQIAAQITAHSLDFLESKWQDLPVRHRSLRAVFDHTWSMLSERERMIFSGLSVFRSAFTLDAAEQVCQASYRDLADLSDLSLIRRTSAGRFEMHELLRQYCAEKLGEQAEGRGSIFDRHTAYYTACLRRWASELISPRQTKTLEEMDLEIDEALAAWYRAIERGQLECLVEGMDGLDLYLDYRMRRPDGHAAFQRAVDLLESIGFHQDVKLIGIRAKLLILSAKFELFDLNQVRCESGKERLRRTMSLLDQSENAGLDVRLLKARSLFVLSFFHNLKNEFQEMETVLMASLDLCQQINEPRLFALILISLGDLAQFNGHYKEAIRFCRESLEICRMLGCCIETTISLREFALVLNATGQMEQAESLALEGIDLCRKSGNQLQYAEVLYVLATIYENNGRYAEYLNMMGEYEARQEHKGSSYFMGLGLMHMGRASAGLGQYDQARGFYLRSLGLFKKNGQSWRIGYASAHLGELILAEGRCEEAYRLLYESETILKQNESQSYAYLLALLGIAMLKMGDLHQAHQHLTEALIMVTSQGNFTIVLKVLSSVVLILAAEGDSVRALEIFALVSRFPYLSNSALFQDLVGIPMTALVKEIPFEVAAAAQQRGRELDLETTLKELVAQFKGK